MARREVLAVLAGQRRGVDGEGHAQHRLVDREALERLGVGRVGEGVADLDLGEARHDEEVAGDALVDLLATDAAEPEQRGEAALERRLALGELLVEQHDVLALAQAAAHDAPDGEAPEVVGGVEVGDDGLQRCLGVAVGCGHGGEDGLEERLEVGVGTGHADAGHRAPLAGDRGDHGEVDVVVGGAEVEEELVDHVEHLLGPGVLPVDLVQHDDGGQLGGQRLLQHVARLGQRPLGGVDEEQHAVDHAERALHLTAEVGVARRVDQVDAHAVPGDRSGLGEDGDAPLALLVVGVHHPLDDGLVLLEGAGGAEHGVDQRGLAVVDVGDEGDVAQCRDV